LERPGLLEPDAFTFEQTDSATLDTLKTLQCKRQAKENPISERLKMRLKSFVLLLGFVVLAWPAGIAQAGVAALAGQEVKKAADSVEDTTTHAAKVTKHAVKHGAKKTGEAVGDAGEATGHAAKKTGRAVKHGAQKTGEAVGDAGEATGHAVKKGAKKTGRATKKAADSVEDAVH